MNLVPPAYHPSLQWAIAGQLFCLLAVHYMADYGVMEHYYTIFSAAFWLVVLPLLWVRRRPTVTERFLFGAGPPAVLFATFIWAIRFI